MSEALQETEPQLDLPFNQYRSINQLIADAITKRWKLPEWGVYWEVHDSTGGGAGRRADAVIVNMWPSRGLPIVGIEIKTHRSDWLRELKNPKKAEAIYRFCNQWWLVTGAKDVAKLEEIPETWGWLAYDEKRKCLMQQKAAPVLAPDQPTKAFMCVLLRHAVERVEQMVHKSEISHALSNKYEEGRAAGKVEAERMTRHEKERYEEQSRQIAAFESAAGLKLSRWEMGSIGKAVALLKDDGTERIRKDLGRLGETALKLTQGIQSALQELDVIEEGQAPHPAAQTERGQLLEAADMAAFRAVQP